MGLKGGAVAAAATSKDLIQVVEMESNLAFLGRIKSCSRCRLGPPELLTDNLNESDNDHGKKS